MIAEKTVMILLYGISFISHPHIQGIGHSDTALTVAFLPEFICIIYHYPSRKIKYNPLTNDLFLHPFMTSKHVSMGIPL